MAATGVRCNYENHPQGLDSVAVIGTLGPLVRHVHVKDVRAPGSHATCPLGEGCVGIRGVIAALHGQRYDGWLSWEDEPEDRNPMDIAARMRLFIEEELSRLR